MLKKALVAAMIIPTLLGFTACSTAKSTPASQGTFKVGLTPDYPPLIFKQGDNIVGAEADFAHMLAGELGQPLEIVPLEWNQLIPALLDGKIDIIMSGMSITQGRKVRIAFSDPICEIGQMALIRQADVATLGTAEKIMKSRARIGIIKDTTGDVFVQRQCPNAKRVGYGQPKDAAWDLGIKRKQIDVFIYDAPAIKWYASANEADLGIVDTPFTREYIAWGLRRNEGHLLDDINRILAKWKEDGTLDMVLKRWIP